MSIPTRIKVTGQGPNLFGSMATYLTVGKEYDVDPTGYYDILDGSTRANTEDVVTVIADNKVPTVIKIAGRCAHGYTYEVVA